MTTVSLASPDVIEILVPGPRGPQGIQGIQGIQGEQGIQGIQGVPGSLEATTYPFLVTAPSNVVAMQVTGFNGGGAFATRNVALDIYSGGNTNNYDVGLRLNKNQHSGSVLEIYDASVTGSNGDYIRIFNNIGSPSVPQKTFYMANDAGLYSRTEIIVSGVFTGDGGVDSTITPPSLEPSMIGMYNDIGGPSLQARTGNVVGGYFFSAIDHLGPVLMAIRGDGTLAWGVMSQFTASVDTSGLMTVTVAPSPANLAVGNDIQAPGLPVGTYITALGTGTGGTGTYQLNNNPASAVTSRAYFSAYDTHFGRRGMSSFRFGRPDSANPIAQTLTFSNALGANIAAAANATICAPLATGNATNGDLVFKTGLKGSSGSGAPTLQTILTLKGETDTHTGNVQIGGSQSGASIQQLTFLPNSGTNFGLGMANGGSQLVVFEDNTPVVAFSGVAIVMRSDGKIQFATASTPLTSVDSTFYRSAAGVFAFGTGSANGLGAILALPKAGAISTSDIPAGAWQVCHDSSGGTTKVVYNDGGTLRTVSLT